jgi:hypothetical protein
LPLGTGVPEWHNAYSCQVRDGSTLCDGNHVRLVNLKGHIDFLAGSL